MEEEGIVSIWLGNFENQDALTAYAEARFQRDENGEPVSSFTQDFFNGPSGGDHGQRAGGPVS